MSRSNDKPSAKRRAAALAEPSRSSGVAPLNARRARAKAIPAPENAEHSELSIKVGRSLAFILGAGFSALTGYAGGLERKQQLLELEQDALF